MLTETQWSSRFGLGWSNWSNSVQRLNESGESFAKLPARSPVAVRKDEANPYGAASDLLAERVASFYTSANLPISYKIGSGGMPNIVYTEMKADDGGFLSEKMIGLISAGLKQAGNEELLAQFDNEVVPEIRAGIKKRGEWENHRADCNREGFY